MQFYVNMLKSIQEWYLSRGEVEKVSTRILKGIRKIFTELSGINSFSKSIIKYGTLAFYVLLLTGTAIIALNRTVLDYNLYYDFVANSIIEKSFLVFAEVVIGGLIIDYIIKRL